MYHHTLLNLIETDRGLPCYASSFNIDVGSMAADPDWSCWGRCCSVYSCSDSCRFSTTHTVKKSWNAEMWWCFIGCQDVCFTCTLCIPLKMAPHQYYSHYIIFDPFSHTWEHRTCSPSQCQPPSICASLIPPLDPVTNSKMLWSGLMSLLIHWPVLDRLLWNSWNDGLGLFFFDPVLS